MTDSSNSKRAILRATRESHNKMDATKNTKAEFKRLKTILPSIRRKEKVSKLDIILEAIKYIDDLQDQLFDRLSGPPGQREAAILALTEQDMRSMAPRNKPATTLTAESSSESEEETLISDDEDDNSSNASLEMM